ncbi:MAG: HD domain-containing protein [Clostridiales bacterium]|nr:HD domain-containing protein [Clostridiales bacterium]
MERVNRILINDKYKYYQSVIEFAERDRIFCCHDLRHCVDVARITMLLSYEEGVPLDKELVYAAALLHDIGRAEGSHNHHIKSAELAEEILRRSGFSYNEAEIVCQVIRNHGDIETAEEKTFSGLFYRADKLSRDCLHCKARGACYWSDEKKNLALTI